MSLSELQDRAIDSYLSGTSMGTAALRDYGAVLVASGMADNGGLTGGLIENSYFSHGDSLVADAIDALAQHPQFAGESVWTACTTISVPNAA